MNLARIASSGVREPFRIGECLVTPAANEINGVRIEAKAMDVLMALADAAPGVLSSAALLERVWPDVVVVDNVVYHAIAQLRKALGDDAHAPRFIQTVSRRGYRLIAEVRQAPSDARSTFATDQAIALSGTPSEPQTATPPTSATAETSNGGPSHARWGTRRWRVLGISFATAFAVAGFAFVSSVRSPGVPAHNGVRIEIAPFETLERSDELERIANQATATMIRAFATAGLNSVAPLQSSEADGSAGHAQYVLRGRIEREGDVVVASADILSRGDGLVFWSNSMKSAAAQVGILRENFSAEVTHVLSCGLHARAFSQEVSTDLFAQYLRLCDAYHRDIEQTPEIAHRIVQTAPQSAYGHTMEALANAFVSRMEMANGGLRPPAEVARLRKIVYDSATRASEIDPRFDASLARAIVVDPTVGLAQRERLLKQSYESEGQVWALFERGKLLEGVGRIRDAHVEVARALKQEPLENYFRGESAWLTAWLGKIEAARRDMDLISATSLPPGPDAMRLWVEVWFGDPHIAKSVIDRADRDGWQFTRDWACVKAYMLPAADAVPPSEEQITAACRSFSSIPLGYYGYVDGVYRYFDSWFRLPEAEPPYSTGSSTRELFVPFMRQVRADPRFMPLAERLKLVDYWLETDQWPDFCTTEKLPYDCKEAALAAHAAAKG